VTSLSHYTLFSICCSNIQDTNANSYIIETSEYASNSSSKSTRDFSVSWFTEGGGIAVRICDCIRETPIPNLTRIIGSPDWNDSWFLSAIPGTCRDSAPRRRWILPFESFEFVTHFTTGHLGSYLLLVAPWNTKGKCMHGFGGETWGNETIWKT
jgi:hypothetical protein